MISVMNFYFFSGLDPHTHILVRLHWRVARVEVAFAHSEVEMSITADEENDETGGCVVKKAQAG